MANNPKHNAARFNQIIRGWTRFAETKSFGGMTLEEFKLAIAPSAAARVAVSDLEADLVVEIANREKVDQNSLAACTLVVNSIRGDPQHGEDSPLYEAVGYVRKSVRKTGLKHPKKKPPTN